MGAAITPKFKFGFVLKEGNPNTRPFEEHGTTQTFNKGDLVVLSAGGDVCHKLAQSTASAATTAIGTGIIGIAGKDATGVDNSLIPVYVISPEQVWEVHAAPSVAPNTAAYLDKGDLALLAYKSVTNYTLSNGTTTMTTDVGAWYVSNAAGTNNGVAIVGVRRGEEAIKGGRLLVKFTSYACAGQY